METYFSETLASTYESTRRQNPQEQHHPHRRENLKSDIFSALKMETLYFSETLASTYESTRRQNPQEQQHHPHCHENLKSDIFSALKMETLHFSETLASIYESTRRQNPKEQHHPHRRENLKSDICYIRLIIFHTARGVNSEQRAPRGKSWAVATSKRACQLKSGERNILQIMNFFNAHLLH
jgi:hypothetical protein